MAEAGTGKLLRVDTAGQVSTLAESLAQPGEVIAASNGTIFVSETGKGQFHRSTPQERLQSSSTGSANRKGQHSDKIHSLCSIVGQKSYAQLI